MNFEVIKNADISRYANCSDKRLVNLGPIALFSSFELTTSSGKHLKDMSRAHRSSLTNELKPVLKILTICLLVLIEIALGDNES